MGAEIQQTRNLFLRSTCGIYMFAFLSIYLQIQGLYGENGILPAHTLIPNLQFPRECFAQSRTFLCFATTLGLNISYMMELLALVGTVLSFCGMVWSNFCIAPLYVALYAFYLSIHKTGQTFMWFQWDSLLLEMGFLTIFVAPIWRQSGRYRFKNSGYKASNNVSMWLVRWLLFRLMFASGVVKLQSGCPTWWGLTALDVHFESQCIPTPFAWFMHHLPAWLRRLSVVGALVIEIPIPFLFFSPIRQHRLFAFYCQVLLQVAIIISGNYNFFNLATIVLCLSLVDDYHLGAKIKRQNTNTFISIIKNSITLALKWIGIALLFYYTFAYFTVRLDAKGGIASDIAFSRPQFDYWISRAVPFAITIGVVSLFITIADSLANAVIETKGVVDKIKAFSSALIYALLATVMFGVSLVPFTVLDRPTHEMLLSKGAAIGNLHKTTSVYQLTSSYGLFRRMTGVGGRPEVIIEGSNSRTGPWKEYEFSSKPGSIDRMPPFVVPHQPRLDWQMWFAALGTYSQNPWIVSMSYRLLKGEKSVTKMLAKSSPWRQTPPKFIRAQKYLYFYTEFNDSSKNWWRREAQGEYFPVYSVDHQPLLDYLQRQYLIGTKDITISNKVLGSVLDKVRDVAQSQEPQYIIWGVFIAALVIMWTNNRRVSW